MIKRLAFIAVLLACLAIQTTPTVWDDWNTYTSTHYSTVHAISLPSVPANFQRYTDASNSTYKQRKNQYRYNYSYTISGTVCNIYCGPRSFLTTVQGNFICKRDQNSNFCGGQSGYAQYCIPDVDTTLACNAALGTMSYIGNCNMASYINDPFYSNYECCYDDENSLGAKNTDLTAKTVTTSYYYLRNAE